ncbi:signal peptidase I [Shouchella patagoniensis]|uniref:signal peptidase I n=1 Tax=Shouchella patagoniensis TaxID=228576 RepID=UPI000994FC76|nr:signal peptidase I [Shouchella patagoniensis]
MKENEKGNKLLDWGKSFFIALGLFFIIQFFLATSFIVQGESMEPTLTDGNRMVINKIGYTFSDPDRFDIVVFHANGQDNYVKRIIGLPGDHISYKDDQLYINGEKEEEPYLDEVKVSTTDGLDTYTNDFTLEELTGAFEVPEDHIFVLGDNRKNSLDSRRIGFIPIEDIIGSASGVYWPLNQAGFLTK